MPLLVRLYLAANRLRQQAFTFVRASFNGFWLGLLSNEDLHAVNEVYYSGSSQQRRLLEPDYQADEHNQRGLWEWEQQMIARFFPPSGRLLVLGAGGGREVVALQRLGYRVEGFECHPGLVSYANALLTRLDLQPTVSVCPRDAGPGEAAAHSPPLDGVIVGWGTYTHIRGRPRRVAMLKQLRSHAAEGSPLLLSFFGLRRHPRRLRLTASTARLVSRLRFGEPIELGDDLSVIFVRYFTEEEVRSELREAGFELVYLTTAGYAHAVGIAAGAQAAGEAATALPHAALER